jgi:hypothetical protein
MAMLESTPQNLDSVEMSLVARAFGESLCEDDLYALLQHLNRSTSYRFTGVYRFEPGWVVSVALYDRENPATRLGSDVKMKESYCWLTGLAGGRVIIEDATCDPRLGAHAARDEVRSYIAVLLRDTAGRQWGTFCHFDFAPHALDGAALDRLDILRPLVEEMFVRDKRAIWDPEAPSSPRAIPVPTSATELS